MPKRVLQVKAPGDLVLEWKGMFKNMTVTFEGKLLGTIATKSDLERGENFTLPDGSLLQIVWRSTFGGGGLDVLRNGAPVGGSSSDPEVQIKGAYGILFFIAILNIALGLLAEIGHVEFLRRLGVGWTSLGFGALFVGFGFAVKELRSRVALILAIVVFVADGIIGIALSLSMMGPGQTPPIGGIMMRVFLLIPMITGVGALGKFKKPE